LKNSAINSAKFDKGLIICKFPLRYSLRKTRLRIPPPPRSPGYPPPPRGLADSLIRGGRRVGEQTPVPHIDNTFEPSFACLVVVEGPGRRGGGGRNFAGGIPRFSNWLCVSTSAAERRKFAIGMSTPSTVTAGILHKGHVDALASARAHMPDMTGEQERRLTWIDCEKGKVFSRESPLCRFLFFWRPLPISQVGPRLHCRLFSTRIDRGAF